MCRFVILTLALLLSMPVDARAADAVSVPGGSVQLQKCLKKADEYPDIGAAVAQAWIKKNGGAEARLCRAFAQANRGMHADAAREFWGLASKFEKGRESDKGRALLMHTLSGQEFLRAKDNANAEARFAAALRIAPNDASALSGRAQCRITVEKYWDALDDLDRALKTHPDDAAALRLRGRVWIALGNDRNAKEDFAHAHAVDGGGAKP